MFRPSLVGLASLLALALAAACTTEVVKVQAAPSDAPPEDTTGTEEDGGTSVQDASTSTKPTSFTFPTVKSRGGKVIAAPRVVPIVYSGDPLTSQIGSFYTKLGASAVWKADAAEYGIGPITTAATKTLTEAPPTNITSTAIEQWLVGKLSGASPLEAPDENTLYAIHYPAATTIQIDGADEVGQSCQGYGGYHGEVSVSGKKVGYAVLPRCSGVDELTVAASHEAFEWATDPYPQSTPAYAQLDDEHLAWQLVMLGELGDLCTFLDRSYIRPADIGFQIQRMWSNAQSLAGKFPCAPQDGKPYFQAIPLVGDPLTIPDGLLEIKSKGAKVPPGGTATVDVKLYAEGLPAGTSLFLEALSKDQMSQGQQPSGFSFKVSQQTAKVGDTVQVTVTAPKGGGWDVLTMIAARSQEDAFMWPVFVFSGDPFGTGTGLGPATTLRTPKRPDVFGAARAKGLRLTRAGLGR